MKRIDWKDIVKRAGKTFVQAFSVVWYRQAGTDHGSGECQGGTLPHANFLRSGRSICSVEHGNELSRQEGDVMI